MLKKNIASKKVFSYMHLLLTKIAKEYKIYSVSASYRPCVIYQKMQKKYKQQKEWKAVLGVFLSLYNRPQKFLQYVLFSNYSERCIIQAGKNTIAIVCFDFPQNNNIQIPIKKQYAFSFSMHYVINIPLLIIIPQGEFQPLINLAHNLKKPVVYKK